MTTLWIAFGIYIVGIAVVLLIRPANMFQPGGGTWKEFGLSNTGNYTIFPFWMFAILWAIVSYALGMLAITFFASVALRSTALPEPSPVPAATANILTPVSETLPPPTSPQLPGYYIMETPVNGAPRYVYFGTSPPKATNL